MKRNRVWNFLKHADRDAKAHISLDEVENSPLLMQVLASYGDLVKDDLGAEGLVLWIYHCVDSGTADQLPEQYKEIASKLQNLDLEEQLQFCSFILRELNASDAQ